MAVTNRALGTKGISAFIVEHGTPGMSAGKKEDKLGMRASDTSEVLFENCRIPADRLLGEEGQGFVNTMQVLDAGRIGIAALSVGLAQGAYEAALAYSKERKAFGKTISSFQAIQWKLADSATRIEAARLLTYRAADLKDRGKGMDVIGMTNLQEAKLAREAELCYATLALVTDYDCWHPDHDSVTVDLIIANLMQNAVTAQKTIAEAVEHLNALRTCTCKEALASAIITRPDQVPAAIKKELAPIIGKYIQ